MNALDTNVLIYSLDVRDPVKRSKARDLLRRLHAQSPPTYLPWQVIGEFVRQLRAWQDQGKLTPVNVRRYANLFRRLFPVIMPTPQVLDRALDLAHHFSLSHWDSMLLGACNECGVDTLYTEDMGSPTTYDGIQLLNPFI
jgi:predicted nucleic acid-binding protein